MMAFVVAALMMSPGCEVDEIQQASKDATAALKAANSTIGTLKVQLDQAKTDKDDGLIAKLSLELEGAEKKVGKLEAYAVKANAEIQKAKDGGDLLVTAVNTAAPFMGPYGGIALLATSVLVGWQRAAAAKKKARQVVQNIDEIIADPNLSGGAGKFDASDAATTAAMKVKDRATGVTSLVRAALE